MDTFFSAMHFFKCNKMASAERWLFRMWHLNFFIILLLFVQQINTTEKSDPNTDATKNVTSQAKTVSQAKDSENKTPVVASTDSKGSKSDISDDLKTSSNSQQKSLKENILSDKVVETTKAATVQTSKPLTKDHPNETLKKNDTVAPKELPKVPTKETPQKDVTVGPKIPLKASEGTLNNVTDTSTQKYANKVTPKDTVAKTDAVDKESKSSINPDENKKSSTPKKPSEIPTKGTEITPNKDPNDVDKQTAGDLEEDSKLDFPLNTAMDPETDSYPNGEDNGDDETPDMKNEDTIPDPGEAKDPAGKIEEPVKPQINRPNFAIGSDDFDSGDSHFFVYFLSVVGMCIIMYILFHNKQKILALIVEGRQERRRRPNTNQYRPLDNNLEEVIQSGTVKTGRLTTNIIY